MLEGCIELCGIFKGFIELWGMLEGCIELWGMFEGCIELWGILEGCIELWGIFEGCIDDFAMAVALCVVDSPAHDVTTTGGAVCVVMLTLLLPIGPYWQMYG